MQSMTDEGLFLRTYSNLPEQVSLPQITIEDHLPSPAAVDPPQVLKPLTKATWKYQNFQNLLDSGIYTPEDLERLHDHVMYPAERPAYLETISRKLAHDLNTFQNPC